MMLLMLAAVLGLVPMAEDLAADGVGSRLSDRPILLYVTHSECTFCQRFETEVLGPLLRAGELDEVMVRELLLDSTAPVRDFTGRQRSAREVASDYGAEVTPTLLIVDADGNLLQPRIVGYQRNDFYSFYLERALKRARAQLASRDGNR